MVIIGLGILHLAFGLPVGTAVLIYLGLVFAGIFF
jgi:hypothetical protein